MKPLKPIHVNAYINAGMSEWVSSVLRPHQHSIGYTEDGFYRSKDPTNSNKLLKEDQQKTTRTTKDRYT